MIDGIRDVLRTMWPRKASPLVTKAAPVDSDVVNTEPQRERERFSAEKQVDAMLYGQDGQLHPVEPETPKLDVKG